MLDLANLDKLIRDDVVFKTIADEASVHKIRVYLVGGFIRDALLGLSPKDADLMFEGNGYAESIGRVLSTGFNAKLIRFEKHMVVYRIIIHGKQYDLADLKESSISQDQLRRDFTINSLAVELSELFRTCSVDILPALPLIDASTSIEDLEKRIIRINSRDVLRDDPLRIVRLFRFESQLGFVIEPSSLTPVPEFLNGLKEISGERVRDELFQILKRPKAADVLEKMDRYGIITTLFPLLDELRDISQNEYHHLDVFNHTIDTIRQFEQILNFDDDATSPFKDELGRMLIEAIVPERPRLALLKLTLLFHDIGKPRTRTIRQDGKIQFIGHDKLGVELIEPYLEYLKLSRREKSYINMLIEGHLRPGFMDPASPTISSTIFRYYDHFGEWGVDLVLMSIADRLAAQGEKVSEDVIKQHYVAVSMLLDAYFNKNKILVRPPDIIDGYELMRALDLRPGKRIGILLKIIKEGQASGVVRDKKSAIEYARRFMEESSKQSKE